MDYTRFQVSAGSVVKPPIIGSRMKPQLYIPTILIHFKVMLISAWKNRLFQKHVRDGPNKPSLRAVAQI